MAAIATNRTFGPNMERPRQREIGAIEKTWELAGRFIIFQYHDIPMQHLLVAGANDCRVFMCAPFKDTYPLQCASIQSIAFKTAFSFVINDKERYTFKTEKNGRLKFKRGWDSITKTESFELTVYQQTESILKFDLFCKDTGFNRNTVTTFFYQNGWLALYRSTDKSLRIYDVEQTAKLRANADTTLIDAEQTCVFHRAMPHPIDQIRITDQKIFYSESLPLKRNLQLLEFDKKMSSTQPPIKIKNH